jgi:hypothetical protein
MTWSFILFGQGSMSFIAFFFFVGAEVFAIFFGTEVDEFFVVVAFFALAMFRSCCVTKILIM